MSAPDGGTDPALAEMLALARHAARDTFAEGVRLGLGYALRTLDSHVAEAKAVRADQAAAWLAAVAVTIRQMAVSDDLSAVLGQSPG